MQILFKAVGTNRWSMAACILSSAGLASLSAQDPTATKLSFDVAAIRPSKTDQRQALKIEAGGRFVAEGFSLRTLIAIAYRLTPYQMSGGDAWIDSERWNLQAKAEGVDLIPSWSAPFIPEIMAARLRALLEERFLLRAHRETRLQLSYALIEAKSGSKLFRGGTRPLDGVGSTEDRSQAVAQRPGSIKAGPGVIAGAQIEIGQFAAYLSRLMDRPVIDRTGLAGAFDIKIQFAPESLPHAQSNSQVVGGPGSGPDLPSDPSFFTALQEQLGLRLESTKVATEFLVIDSAQRPTPN